jgi:hypothetical protein
MKNLAYCVLHNSTIVDWNVIELEQNPREDICCCVVRTLDGLVLLNNDVVLIEKQPSRNNKMRIIEALLNSYFVIKGKADVNSSISKVIVYSAKHKLGKNTIKGKVNYNARKKLSIERARVFVTKTNQEERFIKLLATSKKKDDYADSLLQGLSYIGDDDFKEIERTVDPPVCKIVSRKPTAKQESKGYSKSNLKWIIKNNIPRTDKINKSIKKYYKSIDEALLELSA